ncbi:MAG TPA: AAA family ATPase [Leptospiraceae bacterium]|nr:AAA family ATPase [Leptospiraceae bacterium]
MDTLQTLLHYGNSSVSLLEMHFFRENGSLPHYERLYPYSAAGCLGEPALEGDFFFSLDVFLQRMQKIYPEMSSFVESTEMGVPYNVTYRLKKDFFIQITMNFFTKGFESDGKETLNSAYLGDVSKLALKEHKDFIGISDISTAHSDSAKSEIPDIYRILYEIRKKVYRVPPHPEPPVSQISIICKDINGVYYMADKEFGDSSERYREFDLNLHYGKYFTEKFHEPLLERLKKRSNGIVLLHGVPGTGKTFYIRRLIRDLYTAPEKKVVIVPNTFVKEIATPEFFNFLFTFVQSSLLSLVLVIEDAENLLRRRDSRNSFEAISNILNMTDGLLNDFVHIQIIATFNTELKNIDEALLRHKRLLARKEFYRLKPKAARRLAESVGVPKKTVDALNAESYSAAEIYSLLEKESDDLLLNPKEDEDE